MNENITLKRLDHSQTSVSKMSAFDKGNDDPSEVFVPTQAAIFDNKNKPGQHRTSMFHKSAHQTQQPMGIKKQAIQFDKIQNFSEATSNTQSRNLIDYKDSNTFNNWKKAEDPHKLYQLNKCLTIGNIVDNEVIEWTRWKNADLKGNNFSQYQKETKSQNDLILIPVDKSRLEQNQTYSDRWPLLNFRKFCMKTAIYINLAAMKIDQHKAFEYTSIGVILLNCVQMASEGQQNEEPSQFMNVIEYVFLALYTIELIIKILAKGFIFNKGAYLRDAFNVLDFTIVFSGYLTILQTSTSSEVVQAGQHQKDDGGFSLNALRAFRVLRPLRSITAIKGLKILVQALLFSLPLLKDTIVVLIFFLLIFAIAGIQLISGNLKKRCINIATGRMLFDEDYGLSDGGVLCGSHKCPADGLYYCGKMNTNPDGGVTNYDNIFWAFMNTFQNITLEGWSDTMLYYEMTSGLLIIVFFISSVFIGAFFLLNLTLAVINSSFSRQNERFQKQAQEEREKKRKMAQLMNINRGDGEDDDNHMLPEPGGERALEIGLTEFFIAKRAFKNMVDFYRRKREQRKQHEAWQEEERQRREEELFQEQKRQAEEKQKKEQAKHLFDSSGSAQDGVKTTPEQPPAAASKAPLAKTEVARQTEQPKVEQKPQAAISKSLKVKTNQIVSLSEEQFAETKVHPEQQEAQQVQETPRVMSSFHPPSKIKGDVVQDEAIPEEGDNTSFDESFRNHIQEVDNLLNLDSIPDKSDVAPTRLADASKLMGFVGNEKGARNMGPRMASRISDKDSLNLLEDLGLQYLVADENFQPQNIVQESKRTSEGKQSQNSWDYIYPHYYSDDDARVPKDPTAREGSQSSVISSDTSFMEEMERLRAEAKEMQRQREEEGLLRSRAAQRDAYRRTRQKRKLENRLKNQSFDEDPILIPQNEIREKRRRTIGIAPIKTLRKGVSESNSDFMNKKQPKKKLVVMPLRDNRQVMIDNYKQVDDKFLQQKVPKNPYEYIERKTKKIDINPGAKYISSSQQEVLEPRFQANKKGVDGKKVLKSQMKISKFLKPANIQEEKTYQDDYIEPHYEAYQLKTRYEIKQVEQIEFDDDDEDALILAIQPYDTVRNVGFRDVLQHLPTKLYTSRSDIIVSSTMSITLIPTNEFQKTTTNTFGEDALKRWVDLRNEFRASSVQQAKLVGVNDATISQNFAPTVSSVSERSNSQSSYVRSISTYTNQLQSQSTWRRQSIKKIGAGRRDKKLPQGGLSKPLDPKDITELNEEAKVQYKKWTGKFEASQRMLKKQKDHIYTVEDGRRMLAGTFEHENEVYDEKQGATKLIGGDQVNPEQSMFLNRSGLVNELDVNGFENVIKKVLEQEEIEKEMLMDKAFEIANKKTEIPDEIKVEFDLPDDIHGNKLDYFEVRKSDAAKKRQTPTWSGQDVLCVSYNTDHASYVTENMSELRVWPKGFAGVLKRARFILRKFIMSSFIDNLMTLAVFLNTVVMALDRYGLNETDELFLQTSNSIFTWVFIVEFSMKIVALGPKKYIDNRMNLLDGSIVMLSLLELAMGSGGGTLTAFRSVRVFRTFRVLRVARILRALKSMQQIMSVITKSASSFAYIAVLLMIFLFIFSLLGKQIFGGRLDFDEGKPRGNYDSFNVAFLTSFQTLTMENWNSLLYDAIKSDFIKFISCIYYIAWIFVGNFILLNLFLAILLDSFLEEDAEDSLDEEAIAAEKAAEELKKKKIKKEKERRMKKLGHSIMNLGQRDLLGGAEKERKKKESGLAAMAKELKKKNEDLIDDLDDLNENQLMEYLVELKVAKEEVEKPITFFDAGIHCENALYLLSQENKFRQKLLAISKSKHFDNFVMVLIVLSSFKLAFDSYIMEEIESKTGFWYSFSRWTDATFTILFTFEMLIKIISMGYFMDEGSYMRESWNLLDFFIVMSSLFDLLQLAETGFIKVIRILRILRPLRFISHNKAMKMIVAALLDSGGSLFNVSIVIMVVWLMFAILAINLFAGKFFYCDIDTYLLHSKTDCLKAGGKWNRYDTNFDNALEAMKALFILASLEGWPDIMYQALDATGVDQGPEFENQIYYGYFFITFILIGSFFFLNFMIGVLFLKYTQAQKEDIKSFTQEQMNWMDIQKMIEKAEVDFQHRYQPRDAAWRMKIWKIVNADWFERTVMTAILLNMVQMACSYDGQPVYWQKTLQFSNYVFSSIFLVEAVLKLLVYGKTYFYTTWNKFDFFVVCASILDVLLDAIGGSKLNFLTVAPQLARVLRVLRVTRVLRLAGKNEGLQALLMTIQMSVTSLLNVAGLLMLIFFMFSVLGVSLFQNVKESDDIYTLQSIDPEYKNFKTWHNAFILIFVMSTGENWPLAMYDVGRTDYGVNCGDTTCGSRFSILFFFMFVMVVQNIMLNLFILVIIQQFEQYYVSEDNPIQQFKRNLSAFVKEWIKLTERTNHVKIKNSELTKFMRILPPPIGVPLEVTDPELNRQIVKMGIRSDEGYVDFNEMLYRCMRKQYGQFKLNRAMTIFEIKTQFRLLKLREKNSESNTGNDEKMLVEKMKRQDNNFNPFMMSMFHKITFNRWLNMARNVILKKEFETRMNVVKSDAERLGREYKGATMPSGEVMLQEETIEINDEKTEWLSYSEDSDQISHFESALNSSKKKHSSSSSVSGVIKSPEIHIMKSRHLKYSMTKRFRERGCSYSPVTHERAQTLMQVGGTSKAVQQRQQLVSLGLDDRYNVKTGTNTERKKTLTPMHQLVPRSQKVRTLRGAVIRPDN